MRVLPTSLSVRPHGVWRQSGSTMVEFVVVGPLITLLGLAILQYCMMFFAKSQINHAAFMAARAGSVINAQKSKIQEAYMGALIPLYGGGRNAGELLEAKLRVEADMTADTLRIEMLNPTKESFDDHATNAALNAQYGVRVIPNSSLAQHPNLDRIGTASGQSIQDANLLKLRITHGYKPKIWLVGMLYTKYLGWLDTKGDSFKSQLIQDGRIPVVTHVTLEMQSDAREDSNISSPGAGNGGKPSDPGDPAVTEKEPPQCQTIGCSVEGSGSGGNSGGAGGNSGGDSGGGSGGNGGGVCEAPAMQWGSDAVNQPLPLASPAHPSRSPHSNDPPSPSPMPAGRAWSAAHALAPKQARG